MLEFGKDRRVAFGGSDSLVTGIAWVEDGMLCVDFHMLIRKFCSYLYRNPEGSPEEQNEYIQIGLYQIFTFSIRP